MNKDITLLTSESVTEGHPDKVCDMISDALLDAYLEEDPSAHGGIGNNGFRRHGFHCW